VPTANGIGVVKTIEERRSVAMIEKMTKAEGHRDDDGRDAEGHRQARVHAANILMVRPDDETRKPAMMDA
jgi:hypothetical protein